MTGKNDVSIEEFMRIMDVADALKKQEKEVKTQLSLDEQKGNIRERLRKTYQQMGAEVSDEHLDAAIEDYFSQLYKFKQPEKNLANKIAEAYVNREKIFKKYVAPGICIGAIALSGWGTVKIIDKAVKIGAEKKVESTVETSYVNKTSIERSIEELLASPFAVQLPKNELDNLNALLTTSKTELNFTDSFFETYCSGGTASDDITQSNYAIAKQKLAGIQGNIDSAGANKDKAAAIIGTQQQLVNNKTSLEQLIKEIRNLKPNETFSKQAEFAYTNGISSIEKRQLSEAVKYTNELSGLESAINKFSELTIKAEQNYASIKEIAVEQLAKDKGQTLYSEAGQYIKTSDVKKLEETVNKILELDQTLKEEYTLIITGGVWRYKNSNTSIKNYYLLMHAQDSKGNELTMNITNEETGKTKKVTEWGERVPKGAYDAVGEDDSDNGIIDNNIFGIKKKGFITEEIIMRYLGKSLEKSGEITDW
ncbi:MAG: DUF6384 family protein [Candidatus Woesearchaeota archaeon]|nr:DUF6384 family protein [Candidatus Woesearchaeota archaeon]